MVVTSTGKPIMRQVSAIPMKLRSMVTRENVSMHWIEFFWSACTGGRPQDIGADTAYATD